MVGPLQMFEFLMKLLVCSPSVYWIHQNSYVVLFITHYGRQYALL